MPLGRFNLMQLERFTEPELDIIMAQHYQHGVRVCSRILGPKPHTKADHD